MNYSSYRFSLDLRNTRSSVVVKAKRADTGRKLFITLTDGGVPYHITEDCYAVFTAIKPDGKIVFNDCTIEDCVIIYEMTAQTVAAVGMVESEIIVYGSGGKQLTSGSFHILVEDTIYDTETEIESTSEYNALADLVAQVQALSGVYIGPVQPTDGTLYWLDTSGDGITPAVYTVTNTLTNVARSLVAETVNEGESYSTTLSAEAGYVLSEVSVTMGGVDITAKCYANGNIYIAFVKGDIVITATAVEATDVTYTITNNLFNMSSNNNAVSAELRTSYTATLTADDGYVMDTVTVTMGGVNVTTDVYAGGVVTIPAVTGDVVITAYGKKLPEAGELVTVEISEVATETHEGYRKAGSNLTADSAMTAFKIEGVKAGDIIQTAINNASSYIVNYNDLNVASTDPNVTAGAFVDNYGAKLYIFTAPEDIDVLWVNARTANISTGRVIWTYTQQ